MTFEEIIQNRNEQIQKRIELEGKNNDDHNGKKKYSFT